MKSPLKIVSILLMVALLAGAALACGGTTTPPAETPPVTTPPVETPPAETPPVTTPPVETPPAETPPVTTPPETPVETPTTPSYAAEIFGETVDIPTDDRGVMLAPFEKTSPDGLVTIKFEAGTKITDADGVLYNHFSVKITSEPVQPTDGPTIVGPTVELSPLYARISPAMSYQFNYAGFQSQIDQVPNAEVLMAYLLSNGRWATYLDYPVDTTSKIASVDIAAFETVALIAQTPIEIVKASGGPENGVDITIQSLSDLSPGGAASLVAETLPNAHAMLWMINPSTGTRSAYPADRIRDAGADGIASWDWTLSSRCAAGQGRIELYVTTSTDATFLAAFNGNTLGTIFPSRAAEISKFQNGEIEQLELDDHTTLKMWTVTVK